MAFSTTAKVSGDSHAYELNSEVKKYTLKDLGFTETKAGNYSLERSLDPNSPYGTGYKFKMMVSKGLDGFRMSITTGNGLQKVNIFKNSETQESIDQFNFLINNLVDREVLKRTD
ncbi:DUF1831 domain-containing protein [Lentilactobacillus hilgardii]|uniref:DUF1831 domain-containing protein n=1 Tax=Lentilactobacillus hilgardii TaxID=1588 RepID=UPI0021C26FD1|nr:DUF1831 domain-containing protein [Lentilactobacillus hilgardii]MCP9332888.1 DUF1831 domain-containing protein [Lentilactobacillus hilgardii]MCP9349497.1 DUF1831 domain-containing protein [Lentilactobacillus hilgardii]MCP9352365.1 DUF1831 domain-containing protein [Lentilactobacillus hilgardii]